MNVEHGFDHVVDVQAERRTVIAGVLMAAPIVTGLWWLIATQAPPIPNMDDPWSRLWFAIKCCCVATLFSLVLGVEMIAHYRLNTSAINPIAGVESMRMKVSRHCLQNTVEQLLIFIPGLLALAGYCTNGWSMRVLLASTVVWIVTRFAFWIGYHIAPRFRAPGMLGMVQSMIILLYVGDRFGREVGGMAGEVLVWTIFLGVEAYLVYLSFWHSSAE
ncbi:MAPEG family protein [Dyella flava]|uniref:MAPEG family protein n=1 Tax=Dyella flava TaxID=1920170 RepID=A0ABS2K7S4_9GAMM|nr:MAPEG family protein [Dyella flava]MBM7127231.1 hypothetical protein [Dyella flava]GLQ52187.1 hypothetical protein GCM10010872_36360 [Dyella flava]